MRSRDIYILGIYIHTRIETQEKTSNKQITHNFLAQNQPRIKLSWKKSIEQWETKKSRRPTRPPHKKYSARAQPFAPFYRYRIMAHAVEKKIFGIISNSPSLTHSITERARLAYTYVCSLREQVVSRWTWPWKTGVRRSNRQTRRRMICSKKYILSYIREKESWLGQGIIIAGEPRKIRRTHVSGRSWRFCVVLRVRNAMHWVYTRNRGFYADVLRAKSFESHYHICMMV